VVATSKQVAGDIVANAVKTQAAAQKVLDDPNSTAEQKATATTTLADARKTAADWGKGGIYSRALDAGTTILVGGLAGQAGTQIAANAVAPTVAKTVGDIGSALAIEAHADELKYKELADQATRNNDPAAAADYAAKANAAATTAANWGDNGIYRVGLHAATQGLLGELADGRSGALQSAAGVVGGNLGQQLGEKLGNAQADKLGLPLGAARDAFVNAYQQTGAVVGGLVAGATAAGATGNAANGGALLAVAQGGGAAATVDAFNRQLHQSEYDFAKKYAKLVASKLGISKEEAEGRIVAEILRNSDKQTADAAAGRHDYEIRGLLGCQNLNCTGYTTDANYNDHNYNRQYIASNLSTYRAGKNQIGRGQTGDELVISNVKKDPVGVTVAGTGMVALGYLSGGTGTAVGLKVLGASVGAGANYIFQPSDQKDWTDVGLAGLTGFITTGSGLGSSLFTNVGGSIVGSGVKGENPNPGIAGSAVGTVAGYTVGKAIEAPLGRAIDPRSWHSADWIDMGYGISRWNAPSPIPGMFSGVGSRITQEPVGNAVKDRTQGPKK
jgi:filamentous hemagglutinin